MYNCYKKYCFTNLKNELQTHKYKLCLGKRKMNTNSESDTDIVDSINGGIKDDIACGKIPSNFKIITINFDFDNLEN